MPVKLFIKSYYISYSQKKNYFHPKESQKTGISFLVIHSFLILFTIIHLLIEMLIDFVCVEKYTLFINYSQVINNLLTDFIFYGEKMVKIGGIYQHYKGNMYKVLEIAKYSETLEDMVVYKAMYGEGGVWVRPLSMFEEIIEKDGKMIERFKFIK